MRQRCSECKDTMKHRVLIMLLFLLLGAVVNVAVAGLYVPLNETQ